MNIYSNNKVSEENKPGADILAIYVESLKLFAKQNNNIDGKLKDAIEKLPSPTKIKSDMSEEEAILLYETVDWAWKKLTQHDIIDELKIKKGPKHLMGNYWLLKNGVILSGENHFTIIKNNINLFSSLLNIGANVLLKNMASSPNKVISCAINNGAIRIYVNSKKELYAQLSDSTYADWGKNKIKKLDFPEKFIRVIDIKQPYKGWTSGIVIKL